MHYNNITTTLKIFSCVVMMLSLSCLQNVSAQTKSSETELLADCNRAAHNRVLKPAPLSAFDGKHDHDTSAIWLNAQWIRWPGVSDVNASYVLHYAKQGGMQAVMGMKLHGAEGALPLTLYRKALSKELETRFKYHAQGVVLELPKLSAQQTRELLAKQLLLVQQDADGRVLQATGLQHAAALDALYAEATNVSDLGVSFIKTHSKSSHSSTQFKLWAPTAQQVAVCIYSTGVNTGLRIIIAGKQHNTGVWIANIPQSLKAQYYTYLVDVVTPDAQGNAVMMRHRVTDPYSISLSANSTRSYIANLNDADLQPSNWLNTPSPNTVKHNTDMAIYELHLRDFSAHDATVREAWRGKYLAFTESNSNGMKHLKALAQAGMTDVHLLPVFDIASIPETGCDALLPPQGAPASEAQQAFANARRASDCFNWGYDPLHYTAPEGSYATDAMDGAVRIREFRAMVHALHQAGLRVGMDVVYNHTSASGLDAQSVLDRIVPGYYHRLDEKGKVTLSTCCQNTATEHLMMGKLMRDSVLTWATQYKIDSLRFDLMGHQPRDEMIRLKQELRSKTGRDIQLIGEGWNFGEVESGKRFVQASQTSLNGTGIGTFNDRIRDALRGGSAMDSGQALLVQQGYLNGLAYDANEAVQSEASKRTEKRAALNNKLLHTADQLRVSLAGSLRSYRIQNFRDEFKRGEEVDYNGAPAGYVSEPAEVVNYVENHDNHTLYDTNALKLPQTTDSAERARVQMLGAAFTMFSQGIAYFHAGMDILRSKSLDKNSYDSGDAFNRLDFTYQDNFFGTGLPPKGDNASDWLLLTPILNNAAIKPTVQDIAWSLKQFRDLLRIRASTSLLRMRTAKDIEQRLKFFNTGSTQDPTVIVAHIDGRGYAGANFSALLYAVNVSKQSKTLSLPSLKSHAFKLHPVLLSPDAADHKNLQAASWNAEDAKLTIPARTALVFVIK